MSKLKVIFSCNTCGAQHSKWSGQCNECGAWNTLSEEVLSRSNVATRFANFAGDVNSSVSTLAEIKLENEMRIPSGLSELDRVLGGGIVVGSVILIGGAPGIGKSTILLQTLCHLSEKVSALYVTGEESLQQLTMRARRIGLPEKTLKALAETQVERIIGIANKEKPVVMVIDSVQTLYTDQIQSAPGSVSQVRECAALLLRFAKQTGTAIFFVGHVTKEGNLAGPRVLEHMVDTVLYFEGESGSRYRIIRAVKNRFGAVNELGVFAMTDKGLREVNNPSAIFLSQYDNAVSGSVVMASWEGSRPILVEVQALVDDSHLANPRRISVGLEHNRMAMLLAVLHRQGGVATYDKDVFVNVVGGLRVTETAADLTLLLAILSSLRDKPMPSDLIVFGEVGLAGEIRPVVCGQERLKEAAKLGFKRAIIPKANAPKQKDFPDMEIIPVTNLVDAIRY